ncbi:MAG: oxygenase MpaB family protein [Marinoscillum sp.]
MRYFVCEQSIVRKIWGRSELVLFIFAGASAEFALNKAVDWLYFTGRLPADPLGRLFSTVAYAQRIIYLPHDEATAAIDSIASIHQDVENKRQSSIPQSSYRDVLYMLIDYTIKVHDQFERKLTWIEKEEVFDVFYRMGVRMKIEGLPGTYSEWAVDRGAHLIADLERSSFTNDLYQRYRESLGNVRYWVLIQVQKILCPNRVRELLRFKINILTPVLLKSYQIIRFLRMDGLIRLIFLPSAYKEQIKGLNRSK